MAKETFCGKLLRVHLNEHDRWQDKPLYRAILELCLESGIAGATVYKGVEGFGVSAQIHKASVWPFASHSPVVVTIVDREEAIARLLPRLDAMVAEGLVAISDVEVTRFSAAGAGAGAQEAADVRG